MTVNKEDATRESRAAPSLLLRNAEADPTTKTTKTKKTTTTELTNDLSPSEEREQLSVNTEDDCNNNNNFVVSDIRNLPTSFEGSTNNVATTTTTTSTTTTTTAPPTNNNHTLTRFGGDNNDRPSQPNDTPHVSGGDNNKLQHERRVGTDGVSLEGSVNSINNNPINNNNTSAGKEGLVFKDTAVLNNVDCLGDSLNWWDGLSRNAIYQIFVSSDKTTTLNVSPTDTINHIKSMIYDKVGTLPDQQLLVFGGKPLHRGGCTITDYNIQRGSTLQLITCGGGGAIITPAAVANFIRQLPLNSSTNYELLLSYIDRIDRMFNNSGVSISSTSTYADVNKELRRFSGNEKSGILQLYFYLDKIKGMLPITNELPSNELIANPLQYNTDQQVGTPHRITQPYKFYELKCISRMYNDSLYVNSNLTTSTIGPLLVTINDTEPTSILGPDFTIEFTYTQATINHLDNSQIMFNGQFLQVAGFTYQLIITNGHIKESDDNNNQNEERVVMIVNDAIDRYLTRLDKLSKYGGNLIALCNVSPPSIDDIINCYMTYRQYYMQVVSLKNSMEHAASYIDLAGYQERRITIGVEYLNMAERKVHGALHYVSSTFGMQAPTEANEASAVTPPVATTTPTCEVQLSDSTPAALDVPTLDTPAALESPVLSPPVVVFPPPISAVNGKQRRHAKFIDPWENALRRVKDRLARLNTKYRNDRKNINRLRKRGLRDLDPQAVADDVVKKLRDRQMAQGQREEKYDESKVKSLDAEAELSALRKNIAACDAEIERLQQLKAKAAEDYYASDRELTVKAAEDYCDHNKTYGAPDPMPNIEFSTGYTSWQELLANASAEQSVPIEQAAEQDEPVEQELTYTPLLFQVASCLVDIVEQVENSLSEEEDESGYEDNDLAADVIMADNDALLASMPRVEQTQDSGASVVDYGNMVFNVGRHTNQSRLNPNLVEVTVESHVEHELIQEQKYVISNDCPIRVI